MTIRELLSNTIQCEPELPVLLCLGDNIVKTTVSDAKRNYGNMDFIGFSFRYEPEAHIVIRVSKYYDY